MSTAAAAIRNRAEYDKLMQACRDLSDGREERAKALVDELLLSVVDVATPNPALLSHIVASALMHRIDRRLMASKNIYLQQFDIPQIVLFYKMSQAYPQVAASHLVANQFLYARLRDLERAVILDIGVGKGKQVAALLETAARQGSRLRRAAVIGLDPDPANVADSGDLIAEVASRMPFEVSYHPMCALVEDLGPDDLRQIARLGGPLLINSAYTMHHTSHPLHDTEARTDCLSRLRSLDPAIFTLVEPNADHDVESVPRRLHSVWNHFGAAFDVVDRSPVEAEHRFVVKHKFFGREISNIFGVSDHLRSERHEPISSWLLRLAKAGFRPFAFRDVRVDLPPYCRCSIDDGFVSMGYESTTLLAVFASVPAGQEGQR